MSWESTQTYYRLINEGVKQALGGLHSAKIALYSVDFHEIELLQHAGKWDEAGRILGQAAERVEAAGADFFVLCTNTMHKVAPLIEKKIAIPLLHIADATAEEITQAGIETVGLLGTRFTMEEDFYRGRLEERHGLRVLIPDEDGREIVHRVIYQELCLGKIIPQSRDRYVEVITELANQGAEAVILGCTEISLLLEAESCPIRVFDTTEIHAQKAVEWATADAR